jgi:hypothetical protein
VTRKFGIDLDEHDDVAYNAAKELLEQAEFIDLANLVNNDPVEYITRIIKRTVKGEDAGIRIVLYAGCLVILLIHSLSLSGLQLAKVKHT